MTHATFACYSGCQYFNKYIQIPKKGTGSKAVLNVSPKNDPQRPIPNGRDTGSTFRVQP